MASFKAEVQADSTGKWSSNMLRFATEEDATAYAIDLYSRWSAVRAYRVVAASEAPTDRWDAEQNRNVPVEVEQ